MKIPPFPPFRHFPFAYTPPFHTSLSCVFLCRHFLAKCFLFTKITYSTTNCPLQEPKQNTLNVLTCTFYYFPTFSHVFILACFLSYLRRFMRQNHKQDPKQHTKEGTFTTSSDHRHGILFQLACISLIQFAHSSTLRGLLPLSPIYFTFWDTHTLQPKLVFNGRLYVLFHVFFKISHAKRTHYTVSLHYVKHKMPACLN